MNASFLQSGIAKRLALTAFALVGASLLLEFAQAQNTNPPNPLARPAEITSTPLAPGELAAPDPFEAPIPPSVDPETEGTFQVVVPNANAAGVPVQFSAVLAEGEPVLQRDLIWTVYALGDGELGEDDIVSTSQGGTLNGDLPPGSYMVHVSYGLATLTRPITVGPRGIAEAFNLNAGGMTLRGAISADYFLPDESVTFEVFPEDVEDFETATPLARDVTERAVLVVKAGRYTIVSRYGDVNAIVRAQIDVEPGQLTEAVMFHNAAQITLKLVNEPNGEALPNTAWSVLNLGGDIVREFVGAFPTMVLSEGDYTIIARHDGQVFSREFAVVSGVNREEELVAQ